MVLSLSYVSILGPHPTLNSRRAYQRAMRASGGWAAPAAALEGFDE
ncbi:hypothetical protein SAMN05519103_01634 [Rhizobiales bacterium GAS113]|jgi:hypothetical protein|nr:hypothetical protein SAMN05519103_01634 [Rhizobiales bacterium GAS113]